MDDDSNMVRILFTPTIPHCSMATLIGLSIRVKLLRALPSRFKVRSRKQLFCYMLGNQKGRSFIVHYASLVSTCFVPMLSWKLSVFEIPLDKELTAICLIETRMKLEELILAAMVRYGLNRVQLPLWLVYSSPWFMVSHGMVCLGPE